MECNNYAEKLSTGSGQKLKQQYRDWAKTVKKEGGAFFKTVKDKVTIFFFFLICILGDQGVSCILIGVNFLCLFYFLILEFCYVMYFRMDNLIRSLFFWNFDYYLYILKGNYED